MIQIFLGFCVRVYVVVYSPSTSTTVIEELLQVVVVAVLDKSRGFRFEDVSGSDIGTGRRNQRIFLTRALWLQ